MNNYFNSAMVFTVSGRVRIAHLKSHPLNGFYLHHNLLLFSTGYLIGFILWLWCAMRTLLNCRSGPCPRYNEAFAGMARSYEACRDYKVGVICCEVSI